MHRDPNPVGDVAAVIEQAARDVAYEAGLSAVTLRRVAKRAAVDPATVARHEPSMTVLMVRVFRDIASRELNDIAIRAAELSSSVEALWFIADEVTADSHGNESWVWADAWSVGHRNPAIAEVARGVTAAWTDLVERIVDDGMRTGELEVVDAAFVAHVFLALVDGSSVRAGLSRGTPDQRAEMLKTFLTDALGIARPTDPLSAGV
jgi:AcrR family transcriptional regulator